MGKGIPFFATTRWLLVVTFVTESGKEADMGEARKTRGAWIIHVKGPDDEQDTDAGCKPTLNENEQRNMKDEKEE